MRAIQTTELGKASIVEIPEPDLPSDSILVRPTYVANNPCDFLIIDFEPVFSKGQIVGCDYAGVVEEIGSAVNTSLKPGDKVFGAVAGGVGCDLTKGAFADLIPAYGDYCFPLPSNLDESAATTLGVAMSTVAICLYQEFGIPMPTEDPKFGEGKPFFLYAGSSTTGLMAIQFAKLSGFRVITTCSLRNFDLVKSRGADEVYDYHDVDKCIQGIKVSVGDALEHAFICYQGEEPGKICAEVMSSKGGKYVTIVPDRCARDDVQSIMAYGEAIMCDPYKGMSGIARQTAEEKELSPKFWNWALGLLEYGTIQPPPFEVRKGLEGALKGVEDLRNGLISGKKIVNRLV